MNPLNFKLPDLPLVIIPDTQAHLDGHPVITRTYSLFLDLSTNNPLVMERRKSELHLDRINDADYYGLITFELPDKLFSYTSGPVNELNTDQVEQVIEFLSHYRSHSGLWEN